MQTIRLAGLAFGRGRPKICIPLTAPTAPALLAQLNAVRALPAHLYEWRADLFQDDPRAGLEALLPAAGKPVLCTLRTRPEGGAAAVSPREYRDRLLSLIQTGGFSLVDVELSAGEDTVRRVVAAARQKGIGVVCSRHDFRHTPTLESMTDSLRRMKALGADLPKLAVTPNSPRDVLRLMEATLLASEEVGPVITMSMGPLGRLSRVAGGLTGSCVTFGAGEESSAPGQLPAGTLSGILEALDPKGGCPHEK